MTVSRTYMVVVWCLRVVPSPRDVSEQSQMDHVLVEASVDAPESRRRYYFVPLASLVVPAKITQRGSDVAASFLASGLVSAGSGGQVCLS